MSLPNPYYEQDGITVFAGDALATLREMPAESVQCIVTSPPYWGLRDYGVEGQIGLERTPEEYVEKMVGVFREARRVLADDGVLWLNIGDSYCSNGKWGGASGGKNYTSPEGNYPRVRKGKDCDPKRGAAAIGQPKKCISGPGLKPKDLVGIPWMVAFALRADGWYLRGDHVWGKPNGMPESVEDRPTRGHEYIFLLSKSEKYFYDFEAVRTAPKASTETRLKQDVENQIGSDRANGGGKTDKQRGHFRRHDGFNDRWDAMPRSEQIESGANLRSVWWIAPAQYSKAHFAVMPELMAKICVLAGSRPGDTVLDPFYGSGTVAAVCRRYGRKCIGIELNPDYIDDSKDRFKQRELFVPADDTQPQRSKPRRGGAAESGQTTTGREADVGDRNVVSEREAVA